MSISESSLVEARRDFLADCVVVREEGTSLRLEEVRNGSRVCCFFALGRVGIEDVGMRRKYEWFTEFKAQDNNRIRNGTFWMQFAATSYNKSISSSSLS